MALELELNFAPPPDCDEREALNRTRTWLNCYCADGSHAIQFGKMPMLRLDDYVARTSQDWYRSSSMNTAYDVHLCAYVQIILIMSKWRSVVQDEGFSQNTHKVSVSNFLCEYYHQTAVVGPGCGSICYRNRGEIVKRVIALVRSIRRRIHL